MKPGETRVRFRGIEVERPRPGVAVVRVTLQWHAGEEFVGHSEARDTEEGLLRCAAEATARALESAVGERIRLEVIGVQTVEAFDAVLVIVGLSSRLAGEQRRLVGSCVIREEPAGATARAVLSATNRLVVGSNLIYLR